MTEADAVELALRRAGSNAVTFNAPMSTERAIGIADRIGESGARTVVDLGCGRGALLELIVERWQSITALGVDNDADVVVPARRAAGTKALSDRLSYDVADAATWQGEVEAIVCIGADYAFGGSASMMGTLLKIETANSAVVGAGVWEAAPDRWCLDTFGQLATGLSALAEEAERAGWQVGQGELSTIDEWDEFESRWIGGVRAVGTPEADAFAEVREKEYSRYRGVLGFGWLELHR